VAVWGIPTAICAFIVHGFRLYLLDRWLERELRGNAKGDTAVSPTQPAAGDQA
jgi:uncharacterized membrane protein